MTHEIFRRIRCGVVALGLAGAACAAPSLQPVDPVELSHIVMAMDQQTYDAIVASTFLQEEFANGGVQTVAAGPDESWTGRYVMGTDLYLEILGPDGNEGREPGYLGLAFSPRTQGDIDRIHDRLLPLAGIRAHRFLRTRQTEAEPMPWFHAVSVDPPSPDRRFGAWVMEPHPEHLERVGLDAGALPDRSGYLTAIRELRGQPVPAPERLLQDATSLELALTPGERDDLVALLTAAGWTAESGAEDDATLHGPDLNVRVTVADQPAVRLQTIEFSLTGTPAEPHEVVFADDSHLTVGPDATARWEFDVPVPPASGASRP